MCDADVIVSYLVYTCEIQQFLNMLASHLPSLPVNGSGDK